MKKTNAVAIISATALLTGAVAAGTAQASPTDARGGCPGGHVCLWDRPGFPGNPTASSQGQINPWFTIRSFQNNSGRTFCFKNQHGSVWRYNSGDSNGDVDFGPRITQVNPC